MTRSSRRAASAAALSLAFSVLALAGCAGPGAPSNGGTLADRAQRLRERVEARQTRDVVADAQAEHKRTGRPQAVVCMESLDGDRLLLAGDVVAVRSGVPVVKPRGKPTMLARRGNKKGFGPAQGAGGGTSSATYTVTDALILGAATTSGVRLDLESGALAVREGDDSAYAPMITGAGTTAAAGIGVGAANTGIYSPNTNRLAVTCGGGARLECSSTHTAIGRGIQFGFVNNVVGAATNSLESSISGGRSTITDNVATSIVTFGLSPNSACAVRLDYVVTATAGGDYQAMSGSVAVSVVNKAGTLTASTPVNGVDTTTAASAGTLADPTWTVTTGTNAFTLVAQSDSSLSSPTMTVAWLATIYGTTSGVSVSSVP